MTTAEILAEIQRNGTSLPHDEAKALLQAAVRAHGNFNVGDTASILGIVGQALEDDHDRDYMELWGKSSPAVARHLAVREVAA
jgi:hypothetical protein